MQPPLTPPATPGQDHSRRLWESRIEKHLANISATATIVRFFLWIPVVLFVVWFVITNVSSW